MLLEITNPSSPGASFTKNTNEVLLKTYRYIKDNINLILSFNELRKVLANELGINDNNNRNIYPLLKNMGFVKYDNKSKFTIKKFFVDKGLAYVKTLDLLAELSNIDIDKVIMEKIDKEIKVLLSKIIHLGLVELISKPELNYYTPFVDIIKYLTYYGKISKEEYALLVSQKITKSDSFRLEQINQLVTDYRGNKIDFDIRVKVRNDLDIRKSSNKKHREEGLPYLTSYGYFISLLKQAGIVVDDDKGYSRLLDNQCLLIKEVGRI